MTADVREPTEAQVEADANDHPCAGGCHLAGAFGITDQCNFGCWQKGTQEATAEDEMELHELCRADRCQYAKESATPEFTCREHCVYLEG